MDSVDVDLVDVVALTRALSDVDSTTGRETEAGELLAAILREKGYHVEEQPIGDGRFNVFATLGEPTPVVFSTHYDCVPPFFPTRVENGMLFGRGVCDAKGILAAQVAATERLRQTGERRIGLLYVVFVLILGMVFFHERIGRRQWWGIIFCCAGAIVIVGSRGAFQQFDRARLSAAEAALGPMAELSVRGVLSLLEQRLADRDDR